MPLTEKDTIRIRQFLQKMESGLVEGQQVYSTYHDSNLAAVPSDPTGGGTTGGWHREPTEASNWMSVKTALKDSAGTWGTPIRVFGLQGTETAGVGLSADIPKLEQITFIGDGSSKVGWTGGTVTYGGNSYAIAVKAVSDGNTHAYIYWDDADGQTSFKTTGTFATAIAAHHWMVCINDSGKAIPAVSHRIILGGLIQADTITAAKIVAHTITYDELKQTAGSEAVGTDAIRDSATKIYASGSDASESSNSSSYVTVCSANITSLGGVIEVRFQTTVSDTDLGISQYVRLWSGSAALWELEISPANEGFFSATLFAQPGSGSRTYSLQMKSDGSKTFTLAGSFVGVTEDKGK